MLNITSLEKCKSKPPDTTPYSFKMAITFKKINRQ